MHREKFRTITYLGEDSSLGLGQYGNTANYLLKNFASTSELFYTLTSQWSLSRHVKYWLFTLVQSKKYLLLSISLTQKRRKWKWKTTFLWLTLGLPLRIKEQVATIRLLLAIVSVKMTCQLFCIIFSMLFHHSVNVVLK